MLHAVSKTIADDGDGVIFLKGEIRRMGGDCKQCGTVINRVR